MVDVLDHSGASIADDIGVEKMVLGSRDKSTLTATQLEELKLEVQGRTMAVAFLLGADRLRYGRLIKNMENDYLQGRNKYPTTVSAAYHLLTNWKQDPRHGTREVGAINQEISFHNIDGDDGVSMNNNGEPLSQRERVTSPAAVARKRDIMQVNARQKVQQRGP